VTYKASRSTHPLILKLDTTWSHQLQAPAALHRRKSPQYPLNRRLGGPWKQSVRFGDEKNLIPIRNDPQPGHCTNYISWLQGFRIQIRHNSAPDIMLNMGL